MILILEGKYKQFAVPKIYVKEKDFLFLEENGTAKNRFW